MVDPSFIDVSNKIPIINITCSPISDDALLSMGLGQQQLNAYSGGNYVGQLDWLDNQLLESFRYSGMSNVDRCVDLQDVYDLNIVNVYKEGFSSVIIQEQPVSAPACPSRPVWFDLDESKVANSCPFHANGTHASIAPALHSTCEQSAFSYATLLACSAPALLRARLFEH
ncbi:hypothetical protein M5K25_007638 [Dendrobium thyrsiflorum]|uniref:Uncharacterized protein n=1 Tax=Dendrobium thyrsiflorum TaxID=117978 RepID=A0ABD0VLR9_DENTH